MTIQIFFTEISSTYEYKTADLMKQVSVERQYQLAKFRFDIDRKLSLYSELLVRNQICKELGLKNREIIFVRNKHGKPYLKDHPKFQFNISHTRNAIVAAFSNNEIGIDVEPIRQPNYKIAARFFTPSEYKYILNDKNQERTFYEIWTKKEAYIKYIGTGLFISLKSFDVMDYEIKSLMHTFDTGRYIVSTCCNELKVTKPTVTTMMETELQVLLRSIH